MSASSNQFKHVLRRLVRSPLFTGMTLLTLAIGIGANTAIFSVIEGVLMKPLPYPHPEQLVGVWHTAMGLNIPELNMSPSLYFTYREQSQTFQEIGVWQGGSASITGLSEPEQVDTLNVSEGVLPLLGAKPLLGRTFSHKDDTEGSPETVMLTYGYWQSRFGGDASVIGRRTMVDGAAKEVIGVLPRTFRFLDRKPSLVTPFQFDRAKVTLGNFSYQGVARLRPGVTLAQANADVARMLPIDNRNFPAPPGFSVKMFEDARIGPEVRPFKRDLVGDIGNVLWVLMGTIGMVLLIACANVANLLLVRAEGRQQELAIRAALGAGSGQIARELLLESVTLGLIGGALGLGLAYGALKILVKMGPASLPRLEDIGIDLNVLLFTLAISLVAGVLFGLIPVFKYAGPQLAGTLRGGGRTLSQSRERHRARSTLVVVQVALALVLLISSGLMIRTFQALRQVQPGFTNPEAVQLLTVSIHEAQVKEPDRVLRMQQDMVEKIEAIPGVTSVAMANAVPMEGDGWSDVVFAEGHTYSENQLPAIRRFRFVSPDYFKTMGYRLVAGRDFTWNEIYNRSPVAAVSESTARELWHDPASALGKRIRENKENSWREVIAIVGDVRDDGLNKKPATMIYWPTLMKGFEDGKAEFIRRTLTFVVRSNRTGSESLLKEVRQAIWSVNPNVPVADVRTMGEVYQKSLARTSLTLVMLGIAGAMALLLGVIGIYGVISYSVSQRTREIGIRMAVGARQQELTQMFVRHGLVLAGIGVAFGLVAAYGLTRLMTSLLFEVSPSDPLTYAAVSGVLIAAAVVASYLPARRVSAVDPVEALRAE
jgi:putative ABC transport system permease protein